MMPRIEIKAFPTAIECIRHLSMGMLLLGSFCSPLLAQAQFPLSTGNAWHYSITYMDQFPYRTESYTIRILGDSLMPNGKRYWILDSPDMFGGRYIRSDSMYVYYWQHIYYDSTWSEQRIFNMQASFGTLDTVNLAGFRTVTAGSIFVNTVFGKITNSREYGLGDLIFGDVWLGDGFGYLRYEYSGDYGSPLSVWSLDGCIISDTVYGRMTAVNPEPEIPEDFQLMQNYPNPFNPSTSISFSIPKHAHVRLQVFNSLGQLIRTLVDKDKQPGTYTITWDATRKASGMYLYRMEAGEFVQTKKAILIR